MPDTPNQPESWEQQLHDAANTIPDSLRSRLYAESWSDGTGRRAVDLDRAADIAHAEVERLTAERAALWHLLRKQARKVRTWRRRANTAVTEAVEQTARDMQRAGQLRREHDEARAEVDRLRSRIADAHKVADRLQNNYVLPIMADALRDALDGPQSDPARETALDEMAYESARETVDFAAHWPINTREEQPRVPQPGDRVRVTWRKDGEFISSGRFTEDTVDANGDYTGVSDVQDGWASVEVIEPAPATEKPQFGDQVTARVIDGTASAGVYIDATAYDPAVSMIVRDGSVTYVHTDSIRRADIGKETDR